MNIIYKDMMSNRISSFFILFLMVFIVSIVFASASGYSEEIKTLLSNASIAFSKNNFDEAISNYNKVLKIDPNNTAALDNKGVVLGNLQRYNESVIYFDKVLKINPDNVDALNNKGAALLKQGKYNEAVAYFDKVLKIDPKNSIALSNKRVSQVGNNTSSEDNRTDDYAFCQLEIRNKDNQLVSYIEPETITISDRSFFNTVMDTQSPGKFYFNNTHIEIEKTFVYKEGKQYELIKIVSTDTYEKSGEPLAAETGYEVNGKWVLTAIHDGYQLQFGDASKVTWNVIRPVH